MDETAAFDSGTAVPETVAPGALVRVYEYGALRPATNHQVAADQMRAARVYFNALLENEVKRRVATQQVLLTRPDLAAADARFRVLNDELEAAVKAVQDTKRDAQNAQVSSLDKQRVKKLRADRSIAWGEVKTIRAAVYTDEDIKTLLLEVNAKAKAERLLLRKHCGVFWGTYLIVEQAAQAACKAQIHFRRWNGDGHLAVQVKAGYSTADIHKPDKRVWIDPLKPKPEGTGRQRTFLRTVVHFRVRSDDDRQPVYADVPIVMHRPLPPGTIRWAHLIRRMVADHERWYVQFVVELDRGALPVRSSGIGIAGIDVGWRQKDDGSLRVAMVMDEYGNRRELTLPARLISKDQHHRSLRSIQDKHTDGIRPFITEYLSTKPELPGVDLENASPHLWRARRIHRFFNEAKGLLPAELRQTILNYILQHRHLHQWEAHEAKKVQHQRREMYRLFSNYLAQTYHRLVLEKFDLTALARRPNAEDGSTTYQRQTAYNRTLAAISILRGELTNACSRTGCEIVFVDAAYTTAKCHACGHVNEGKDYTAKSEASCDKCKAIWDQDENAALNLCVDGVHAQPLKPRTRQPGGRFRKKAVAASSEAGAASAEEAA